MNNKKFESKHKMHKTLNNYFRSKHKNLFIRQKTGKHAEAEFVHLRFTILQLMKSHIMLFQSETVALSFVHLMMLIYKVFIIHYSKHQFVVLFVVYQSLMAHTMNCIYIYIDTHTYTYFLNF